MYQYQTIDLRPRSKLTISFSAGYILLPNLEGVQHPCMGMTFEESNEYFQNKFKTCFAWEVMKVFSGPPKVVFSWRHWAHMNTSSLTEETNGEGKLIELSVSQERPLLMAN